MHAYRDCADTPVGFDLFLVTYFKAVGNRYATRQIEVWPLSKEAIWAGNANFPRPFLFGWKEIDLGKLKVTMDDALRMAEANGGKAARQAANNNCSITITLVPNVDDGNWHVYYDSTTFQFSVSPY